MLHLMLLTAYILINHLDNCARPSKCLNDQGGNNLVRGNKEAFITLPISYSKFFIPVSNPEYDAIRKFNINMVSMYSGGEGLNKVHLTTDVWGDSDVDKEIYCGWLTVGI